MSLIKLFGFTQEQAQQLAEDVGIQQWEQAPLDEPLKDFPDTIWLVRAEEAERFIKLLLLPSARWIASDGKLFLFTQRPNEIAVGTEILFGAVLYADSPEDLAYLRRVSHCGLVVRWQEWVAEISTDWFGSVEGDVFRLSCQDLPFFANYRGHLENCTYCCQEILLALHSRMIWYRLRHCVTVPQVTGWLRGNDDFRLEAHIPVCNRCRRLVHKQAGLWVDAGIVTYEQAFNKLKRVALA